MDSTLLGVVVPTLGSRMPYLSQCLESIRRAGSAWICIVAPVDFDGSRLLAQGLANEILIDPGQGLPEAINMGLTALPKELKYVTWLGDDDLLEPDSLAKSIDLLNRDSSVVATFGICNYIDANGEIFYTNAFGQRAISLIRLITNKVPQPGSLLRRESFEGIGLLDTSLGWAFDQDMFTKLSLVGKVQYVDHVVASFRWHPGSLSAGMSSRSNKEAIAVRRRHQPWSLKALSPFWEYPVYWLTLITPNRLNRGSNRARR